MKKGQKKVCTVTAKLVGKPDGKTITVHFSTKDRLKAIKFASGVFQALAQGKGVYITFGHQKPLDKKIAKISVTAPK